MGAISNENGNSKEWKLVMHGYKILHGGDLNETLQFWRAWGETSHAWLQNPFFIYERNDLVDWIWFDFSQKLTSWVFNDQPCECADVGQSRTIGWAAKIGWEKKLSANLSRKWLPIRRHGSDFIYTKNSARPRSDFLYTKNVPPPRADFLYTHSFGAFVRFCKWKKASIYWIT